jgi:hypothetical protein
LPRLATHWISSGPRSDRALRASRSAARDRDRLAQSPLGAAYLELLTLANRYADERARLGSAIFEHGAGDGPHPRPELRIRPRL